MYDKDSRAVRHRLERGRTTLIQERRRLDRQIRSVEEALRALGAKKRGRPPKVEAV